MNNECLLFSSENLDAMARKLSSQSAIIDLNHLENDTVIFRVNKKALGPAEKRKAMYFFLKDCLNDMDGFPNNEISPVKKILINRLNN